MGRRGGWGEVGVWRRVGWRGGGGEGGRKAGGAGGVSGGNTCQAKPAVSDGVGGIRKHNCIVFWGGAKKNMNPSQIVGVAFFGGAPQKAGTAGFLGAPPKKSRAWFFWGRPLRKAGKAGFFGAPPKKSHVNF